MKKRISNCNSFFRIKKTQKMKKKRKGRKKKRKNKEHSNLPKKGKHNLIPIGMTSKKKKKIIKMKRNQEIKPTQEPNLKGRDRNKKKNLLLKKFNKFNNLQSQQHMLKNQIQNQKRSINMRKKRKNINENKHLMNKQLIHFNHQNQRNKTSLLKKTKIKICY